MVLLLNIYRTSWSSCWNQIPFILKFRGEAAEFYWDFIAWQRNPVASASSRECTMGKWEKIQVKFINLKNSHNRFSLCSVRAYSRSIHVRIERSFPSTVYAACPVFMHSCVTLSYPAGTIGFSVMHILLTFSCWDCIEVMLLLPSRVASGDGHSNCNLQKWSPADFLGRTEISYQLERLTVSLAEVIPTDSWTISVRWAL